MFLLQNCKVILALIVVLTLLCVKVAGPALQKYHNKHVEKDVEFGITQKIYVSGLTRNKKIISNNPVRKTNVFVLM